MSKQQKRSLRPEFKLEAAQLVVDKGYSVREAAASMVVGHSTMDRWASQQLRELNVETLKGFLSVVIVLWVLRYPNTSMVTITSTSIDLTNTTVYYHPTWRRKTMGYPLNPWTKILSHYT